MAGFYSDNDDLLVDKILECPSVYYTFAYAGVRLAVRCFPKRKREKYALQWDNYIPPRFRNDDLNYTGRFTVARSDSPFALVRLFKLEVLEFFCAEFSDV